MNDEITKFGFTIKLHDFGQRIFETYQTAVVKASRDAFFAFDGGGGRGVSAESAVRGEAVRAALQLGILSGIDEKQINEAKPYVVTWLADVIKNHVITVTTEPTDPN